MPPRRTPRIQVTGRARAGKTTLCRALSLLTAEETGPLDRPGRPNPTLDADLLLYVLPGLADAADRRILATLPTDRTLVALNKADAIGVRWSDAATTAEALTADLGRPVFPVVAALAARTRAGTLDDADLTALRRHRDRPDPPLALSHDLFLTPGLAPDFEARRALLDRWDLFGVSCALTALRHDPGLPAQRLLQILHCASGIDRLHREIHRRYEAVAAGIRD
ncbi:GTPase domain-containing protein [Nocardia sp. NPDC005746]|uniref:GTPase domain-containing protein n=1 Tax=Nocardia sp. NPDC005746 TaxID=3157062 RepID=UPI0033E52394